MQTYTSQVGATWSSGVNIVARKKQGDGALYVLMSNPSNTSCVHIYDVVVPHLGFAQVNYDKPSLDYSDG